MWRNPIAWILGIFGIVIALATAGFAMLLGGAGHGWITPMWVSFATTAFFPITYFRLGAWRQTSVTGSIILIAIGAFSTLMLITQTASEGVRYFESALPEAWFWIAMWSSWIIAALVTTLLQLRAQPTP
jgi:hypothetical protein